MSIPFVANQLVRASAMNRWNPVRAMKGSDESVTSSTVLQDDDALSVELTPIPDPLGTPRTYEVVLRLAATATSTGDLTLAWATTGDIELLGQRFCQGPALGMTTPTATNMRMARATTLDATVSYGVASTGCYIEERFQVACTITGRLQLQWTQDSAAGSTTVTAGSVLTATPIPNP